jgi:hypothetical protein
MPAMSARAAASHGSNPNPEPPVVGATGAGWAGAVDSGVGAVLKLSVGELVDVAGDRLGIAAVGGARSCAAGLGRSARVAGASALDRGGGTAAVERSASPRGVVAGALVVAGASAGRVGVPGKLKFCSSRGPIASVAGLVVSGG